MYFTSDPWSLDAPAWLCPAVMKTSKQAEQGNTKNPPAKSTIKKLILIEYRDFSLFRYAFDFQPYTPSTVQQCIIPCW